MSIVTIYMPLLNEGTDMWTPVKALRLNDGRYRVLGPAPKDQEWTFAPGAIVRSQRQALGDDFQGVVAVAVES